MGASIQPGLLRAVAFSLFAIIVALLLAVSDPVQGGAVLFVVPVALLALSDGLRGGIAGAVIATVMLVAWSVLDDVALNAIGYGSRITSYFVIGPLVGRYEDLARDYEKRKLDERYATELHDRVVQELVVARYQLSSFPEARKRVDEALEAAKDIISTRLGDVEPGDLRMTDSHPAVPPQQQRDR